MSDFLYSKIIPAELDVAFGEVVESDAAAMTSSSDQPPEAEFLIQLWLLVLNHITSVIADSREEVRNGAVHTIIRIFDNHGDDFSPRAWELCFRRILLEIMFVDLKSYQEILPDDTESADVESSFEEIKSKVSTSRIIVEGVCKLFATNIETIVQAPHFNEIWQSLFSALEAKLQLAILDLCAEVYTEMAFILSKLSGADSVRSTLIQQVWSIWAAKFPIGDSRLPQQENQPALLAYLKLFKETYTLVPSILDHGGSLAVADRLKRCIDEAVPSAYSSDVDTLTSVQVAVLETFSAIKTTTAEIALPIIEALASYIAAPFRAPQPNRPANTTFVALSKKSMDILETLVKPHIDDKAMITEPHLMNALKSLEKPIQLKYEWTIQGRAPPLWQKATTCSLNILDILVPHLAKTPLEQDTLQRHWNIITQIAVAIGDTKEDFSRTLPNDVLLTDEQFDIRSIKKFHSIVIPSMGIPSIPDLERRTYASALFKASILHEVEEGDLPEYHAEPLSGIYDVRFGRTFKPAPVLRYEMAYCGLDLLLSMVMATDGSPERVKLAQAAAPYLILRCALPIKAYIADQPLRGRMPLPTSERKELLYVLRRLKELNSEPRAIPDAEGAKSAYKKHLLRLYPLMARAVGVAGRDPVVLKELQTCLAVVGDEFGL